MTETCRATRLAVNKTAEARRAVPPHGTSARYKGCKSRPGCRCRPCTDAAVRDDQMRVLDRLAGNPRVVPSGPVVAHLRVLRSWGMSWAQIGHAAGLSEGVPRHHVTSGGPTMLRRTAEKLLAVQPGQFGESGWVVSVGTVRRVRALFALGHSRDELAQRLGLSPTGMSRLVGGDFASVRASVAAAAVRVYDELSMSMGPSMKNRYRAEREGWAPPLAWDEESIDDPNAEPVLDVAPPAADCSFNAVDRWLMGESVVLDDAGRREAISHLFQHTTLSPAEIGARLDINGDSAKRAWERVKARAREEGRPVPYRRLLPDSAPILAA